MEVWRKWCAVSGLLAAHLMLQAEVTHRDTISPQPHHWEDHWSVGFGIHGLRIDYLDTDEVFFGRLPRLGVNLALDYRSPKVFGHWHAGISAFRSTWSLANPRIPIKQLPRERFHTVRMYTGLCFDPHGFKRRMYLKLLAGCAWAHSTEVEVDPFGVYGELALGFAHEWRRRTLRLEMWWQTPSNVSVDSYSMGSAPLQVRALGLRLWI